MSAHSCSEATTLLTDPSLKMAVLMPVLAPLAAMHGLLQQHCYGRGVAMAARHILQHIRNVS
jgi:hypothetical protein